MALSEPASSSALQASDDAVPPSKKFTQRSSAMIYYIGYSNAGDHYPDFDFVDFDINNIRTQSLPVTGASMSGVRALEMGVPLDPMTLPSAVRMGDGTAPLDYVTLRGASIVSEKV